MYFNHLSRGNGGNNDNRHFKINVKKLKPLHTVCRNDELTHIIEKIFRQINSLVISLVKALHCKCYHEFFFFKKGSAVRAQSKTRSPFYPKYRHFFRQTNFYERSF